MSAPSWDIFCRVVDNYGDIGVCWRLARQLACEHGARVRLWVDRLRSFRRLCPRIDPGCARQFVEGVEVRRWDEPFAEAEAADVVVEAFACHLPQSFVAAMARRAARPVWINLEYLSAEDWVGGCHTLASPHPSLPLTKYFFFPGFVAGSGGVLGECGLQARRRAFLADRGEQAAFWRGFDLPSPEPDEIRVSLFSYPNRALAGLLDAWSRAERPTVCMVPEGEAAGAADFLELDELAAGDRFRVGNLTVSVFPFLGPDDYDRLLWACDCNFVRGEDSFMRAQWASRPFVWHIYPQQEAAHWPKLHAFVDLYCDGLGAAASATLRRLWEAWNRGEGAGEAWPDFWRHRLELDEHAGDWVERIQAPGDLARNLAEFVQERLK